jgi:Holliday junction resolvase RusA-like endonuclease
MNIIIPMEPVAKGRPKFTRQGFAYTPTKTRQAEKFIAAYVKSLSAPIFSAGVPLAMDVVLCCLRPKSAKKRLYPPGDIDNYVKLILDALQGDGGIIPNDNQIVQLRAAKRYDETARIEIEIMEVKQ